MKIILVFIISLIVSPAFSATTLSAVTNASNTVDLNPQEGLIEILGGLSGTRHCSLVGTVLTTLDTCALATAQREACNFRTICNTTELNITLKSDSHSGTIKIVDSDDQVFFSQTGYTSGSSAPIRVRWSEICRAVTGNSDCGSSTALVGSKNLYIGIDDNGDDKLEDSIQVKFGIYGISNASGESIEDSEYGVSDYELFPGDEKAYIKRLDIVNENLNITGAAEIIRLRGFFIQGTCAQAATILPSSPNYVEVDLHSTDKKIIDRRVTGLANGIPFTFMFGLEDKAGNIGYYKNLIANCDVEQEEVTPQEVYGLLSENQNCFITTAAFGSPLNAKVQTFRNFRDQVLLQFSLGQKLIDFYYEKSPPIAKVIADSETLRTLTRVVLWPAWAFAALTMKIGIVPVLLILSLIAALSVALVTRFRVKKSSTATVMALALMVSMGWNSTALAQDDFFTTEESAPMEPPYTGTENDEFSEEDLSELEVLDEPVRSNAYEGSNPNKWKPFQRVPDEGRLEELSHRGLFKITKKGAYLYDVDRSPQNSAASFKVGTATFPNLYNPQGNVYFDEIYDTNAKPMLFIDYEWQFFRAFGKLGIKVGSGLMFASGKGQFENPYQGSKDAEEKYTFFMFPNSLSLVYRMQIFNKQWLVPYGEVGVDYMTFIETRDDGEDIKFGGSPHFHFAVGGAFLLDLLGRDMMAEVDRQYGINHMWLTAEYRRLESMGGDFDFSDDVINAGIMVEF